jgi:hypothetical protein
VPGFVQLDVCAATTAAAAVLVITTPRKRLLVLGVTRSTCGALSSTRHGGGPEWTAPSRKRSPAVT